MSEQITESPPPQCRFPPNTEEGRAPGQWGDVAEWPALVWRGPHALLSEGQQHLRHVRQMGGRCLAYTKYIFSVVPLNSVPTKNTSYDSESWEHLETSQEGGRCKTVDCAQGPS